MELARAPLSPWDPGRLPGMAPLEYPDWLDRDEAFAPQMAYRDRLIAEKPEIVLAGEGAAASDELLDLVLSTLRAHGPGYEVGPKSVTRPDGVTAPIDRGRPFATVGRLAQEDFLLLRKPEGGDEHVLVGAVLCFPSRWSLAEKMSKPLIGIHARVPAYDGGLARRVQRLFDFLTPEQPLARANWLVHPTSELHQPKLFNSAKKLHEATGRFWLRVERQSILKLKKSGACVFTVKTFVTPIEALTAVQRESLIVALEGQCDEMRDYHGGGAHDEAALAALRGL
ncbi:MAG: DUF3445 domain-containing protein [Paracoccaceae bacterium]